MQIVIDIDEYDYDYLIRHRNYKLISHSEKLILQGTVLPTHGRLIDADEIVKKHWWADGVHGVYAVIDKDDIDQAPTVLEASKDESID